MFQPFVADFPAENRSDDRRFPRSWIKVSIRFANAKSSEASENWVGGWERRRELVHIP